MKIWKDYTLVDLILILSGMIVLTLTGLIFSSPWYIIVNTLLGLLCVFTQAKGKVATQFIGIVYFLFYIYISYSQKYYGEAIIYTVVLLPMYIYGAIEWMLHKDNTNNVVLVRSNLSKIEWIIGAMGFVIVTIGIYFLLLALKTEQLILNTLSFVSMLPALYLLMRRCKWNQVAFLFNDFIVPMLWLALVIQGDFSFLPMCIYHIFQITYDIYGLFQWMKIEKEQANDNKNGVYDGI